MLISEISLLISSMIATLAWEVIFNSVRCLAGYCYNMCRPFALRFPSIRGDTFMYGAVIQTLTCKFAINTAYSSGSCLSISCSFFKRNKTTAYKACSFRCRSDARTSQGSLNHPEEKTLRTFAVFNVYLNNKTYLQQGFTSCL